MTESTAIPYESAADIDDDGYLAQIVAAFITDIIPSDYVFPTTQAEWLVTTIQRWHEPQMEAARQRIAQLEAAINTECDVRDSWRRVAERVESEKQQLERQRDEALAILRRHPADVGTESRIQIAVQALTETKATK